eukprot:749899-Hanusia_phi.AAC.3
MADRFNVGLNVLADADSLLYLPSDCNDATIVLDFFYCNVGPHNSPTLVEYTISLQVWKKYAMESSDSSTTP